jgi:hypothetical protein
MFEYFSKENRKNMNELEKALNKDDSHVDIYFEDTSTFQIRADIEEIRMKAAMSSGAGEFREEVRKLLKKSDKQIIKD